MKTLSKSVLFAASALACAVFMTGAAEAKMVALAMEITVDQIAPEDEGMYNMGQIDHARIIYDDTKVDKNKHVRILQEAHLIGGHYFPNFVTEASVLDLSKAPYTLNYMSSVNHGRPLVVLFEGVDNRMAILARPDFHMLIAGHYVINPVPIAYDPNEKVPQMHGLMPAGGPGAMPPGGMPPGGMPPH